MLNRLTKIGAGIAAVAALALGGSALASAAQSHQAKPAPVQQSNAAQDGDNVQEGDQTAPDTAGSADQSSEQANESTSAESGPSDGPGGYADTTSNADTQQQGEN